MTNNCCDACMRQYLETRTTEDFAKLYHQIRSTVAGQMWNYADVDEAETVLDEVLFKLSVEPEIWDQTQPIIAFVLGALRMGVHQLRRRDARRLKRRERYAELSSLEDFDSAFPSEDLEAVKVALTRLPQEYRHTLIRIFYEGASLRQIAQEKRVTERTVKRWKRAGVEQLGQILSKKKDSTELTVTDRLLKSHAKAA